MKVPAWVTDGWYSNNPSSQALAIARYHMPVTTPAERARAKAFAGGRSHPCSRCGRFAFPDPSAVCFWCRR